MSALDPAVADLLAAIGEALDGMADWRAVRVRSAIGGVVELGGDPGVAADWLREFLAERAAKAKEAADVG